MPNETSRVKIVYSALITLVAVASISLLLCWRPGGPMNRHVWMSEQIKPLPQLDTYALNTPMQTIPMEIDIRHGDRWVSVKLDVCMKHGEWRVLP